MSAAVTQGGRFVYVDDQSGQLYIESTRVHGSFSLLYGSTVYAVAIQDVLGIIALLCPADTATGPSRATSDEPRQLLRLYKLVGDDLTDLLAEVPTRPATEVMWVGRRHIVLVTAGGRSGTRTAVYELGRNNALRLSAEDAGVCPCRVLSYLALLDQKAAGTMVLWNVERNKVVDKYYYPTRRERRGRRRPMSCVATSSVNELVFLLYDTDFVHAASLDKEKRLRTLTPPLLTDLVAERSVTHGDGGGSNRGSGWATSASSPRLLVAAVSEARVLLGLQGGSRVVQYGYDKAGRTLRAIDTARLPPGECLVALSATRCLVRTRQSAVAGRAMGAHALSPYHTLVLGFASDAIPSRDHKNITHVDDRSTNISSDSSSSTMSVVLERLLRHTMAGRPTRSEDSTAVVQHAAGNTTDGTTRSSAARGNGSDQRRAPAATHRAATASLLLLGVTCGVTVAALYALRRVLRHNATLSHTQ